MFQPNSESDTAELRMMPRAIFTIASANYISYAATLMQSVREHHPEVARYIVLADTYREFPGVDLAAEILTCGELGIPLIRNMQLWYSITEFNTAIKPFAFRHLFAALGHGEAVYLDPDILVLAPLREVFEALAAHSCVLTPHMMRPLQDGKEPSDLTIMKSGVYNLGFLGLRKDADTTGFVGWWSDRCVAHCRVDIAGNMFTDQRWMDLAPAFIEGVHILRHPGYNVAYWNLAHRRVEKLSDGSRQVNSRPLVFFHFSGIEMGNPKVLSRHQNRFSGDELVAVRELFEHYRTLVRAAGWERTAKCRYAFSAFPNGRPIESPMRRWLLRAIDDGRISTTEPARIDSNFFDLPDETAAARGISITRTMYQLWLDRSDLQTVFDIYTPDGLECYYNWFLTSSEAEGFDGRTLAAAEALRNADVVSATKSEQRRSPRWASVADTFWRGAAAEAETLLRSDVALTVENARVLLPLQAALAWELRVDLQKHYPLANLDSYQSFIAWVLGGGIVEGTLDPRLLSEDFIRPLLRASRLSLYYRDVPLTEGLLVTRGINIGREALGDWRRFPAERPGRLAHALWFAFVAPKLFRWPSALVEPVKSYFEEETEIAWAGFRLNRAELALWELRPDLQRRFPLTNPRSCWNFLYWLVVFGLRELKLSVDEFDPRLGRFLRTRSPRYPGLPQSVEMLYQTRLDLQSRFDISNNAGRLGLLVWAEQNFRKDYAGTPAETLYPLADDDQAEAGSSAVKLVHRAAVALTGQWKASTGRGEDIRRAAEALLALEFRDFLLIDRDSGRVLRPDGESLAPECRVEVGTNVVFLNADTALQDWHFLQETKVGAQRTIGFWAWELERLPPYWRQAFSFYDEIWAATEFARAAFAAEEARPVKSVPLAVAVPEVASQPRRAALGLPDDATVFLFMFDFHSFASRKNPEGVVAAFQRAFPRGTENVFLLLKTQCGGAAPEAWSRLNEMCTDPRIEIRDATVERADVIALIRSADAFVSLHRSEGFGRGPAEAMLLGKPVILTGYSGTADFATPDCAYVVGYELKPVAPDEYPGVPDDGNVVWAEPDIDMAASCMRRVHEEPEAARALGKRASERIAQLYGAAKVGAAMLEALGIAPVRAEQPPATVNGATGSGTAPAAPRPQRARRSRRLRPQAEPAIVAK